MHSLIIFDMDGTIFKEKNLWGKLHAALGTEKEGEAATKKHLVADYDKLVDIVIHDLWRGKPSAPFIKLVQESEYMAGIEPTIKAVKARGYEIAIITGGPTLLMERAMEELGIDHGIGNCLEIKEGIITGRSRHDDGSTMFPVRENDKMPNAEALAEELGFTLREVIAVGDADSDLSLFKAVGKSIAFNTQNEALIAAATHHVEGDDLTKILDFL